MNIFPDRVIVRNDMVPVLGIAPLLVVTDTVTGGTTAGITNLIVLVLVCLIVSAIRNFIPLQVRLPVILLISSSVTTLVVMLMQVFFYETSLQLGVYLSLISVSCLILVLSEEHALRNNILVSITRAVTVGTGVLALLVAISVIREYSGLSLLKQPMGAFLILSILLATINAVCTKSQQTNRVE